MQQSKPAHHTHCHILGPRQPALALILQFGNVAHRHSQRGIAVLVLRRTRHVVEYVSAHTRAHDDIAHLYLQCVALQIDRLFLQRQLARPGVLVAFFIRRIRKARSYRQLQRMLLLRNAQAGNQLLVDLRVRLDAAQHRHGGVDGRLFVVRRPWRIFLALFIDPRLG